MTRFTFANLASRGSKPKASDEAEPDTEVEAEDAPAEEEEDTGAAAEGEDAAPEEDEEGEGEEVAASARRKGFAAGRKAERKRCAAIFAAADPASVAMAAQLAFNTSLSADEAVATLAAAPKAGGGLGARMQGRNPAAPSAGAAGASSDDDKAAERILALRRPGKAA
ncbi:hypothetical protein SAMN05444336_112112 [Albimonas donghaensis]|uniref:Uncharacterized protein n=1 Tax=Albimonas donghaensis TaxID=356660 RepID=A0A1H3FH15_9RHOB|nr:hypothetical protein [Albimonas donghaensis]SDX90220.1 hypothetical protein SAMN05444336_112112 [Albimonas donghaensis]